MPKRVTYMLIYKDKARVFKAHQQSFTILSLVGYFDASLHKKEMLIDFLIYLYVLDNGRLKKLTEMEYTKTVYNSCSG